MVCTSQTPNKCGMEGGEFGSLGETVCFGKITRNKTSDISISQNVKASNPSILKPMCSDITSASVLLSDSAVSFLLAHAFLSLKPPRLLCCCATLLSVSDIS